MKRVLFLLLTTLILLSACQTEDAANEDDQNTLTISTTIFALEDFISKIGGDYVDVESIYPPNADAHTYEPSSREMVELAKKDAFLYSGVGMEPFAEKAEEILADEDVAVVPLGENVHLRGEHNHDHEDEDAAHEHKSDDHDHSHNSENSSSIHIDGVNDHYHSGDTVELEAHTDEDTDGDNWKWYSRTDSSEEWVEVDGQSTSQYTGTIDESIELKAVLADDNNEVVAESEPIQLQIDNHDGESGIGDPHVFIDPILSIQLAENIKNTLIDLLPEQEEYFTVNFEEVKSQLEQVDQDLQQTFDNAELNHLIVSHAAYGYWEERYGLEQISIHGLSPTQEPSQSELVQIINAAEEYDLKYVAFENNVSSKVSEIIQSEIGADSITLRNMETITQEDIDNGEDYFSLMEKNIEALEKALSK
ncbi:zinc ABC transporter substrate-binding protein [Oceanobacillus kimchii]|uniref:metal ABC transporter solute-binding protein, Zn/Mn family n=1 Tax=Oceanobacillus kimchii TaxID=746691 RepID=UPI0021A6C36B|nr:zinc ABC transporter substrate-binding protein [Oceanobacillus kimchii]MCT1577878.1 zinc ABC transporter substrate-binding protein [Oceanobacillus kimchii]MCT2136866.1 zinc ABC transporter substrate-binding protein [Oceanobacillus kimchii]